MEQHRATRLCRYCDSDADQVCGKCGPDVGLDFRDRAIQVRRDRQFLLGRDDQVIPFHLPCHTQALKDMFDHLKIIHAGIFDADAAMCHSRRSHKADHFQVIWPDRKLTAVQLGHAMNVKGIGANLFDLRAQEIKKIA